MTLEDSKQSSGGYRLKYYHATSGNALIPSATVKLQKGNSEHVASKNGDGPVEAIFKAIDAATGLKTCLKEYIIQAIGSGKDARGQVNLLLEIDGLEFAGKGTASDILEASGIAHLNAVNQYVLHHKSDTGYSEPLRC